MRADRVAGGAALALALAYGWSAWRLEPGFVSDPVGPKAFPLGVALLLAGAGLYLVLRPDPDPPWPPRPFWPRALATGLGLVLYAYLLRPLGFVPTTALAVALLARLSGAAWPRAFLLGFGLALALYGLFGLLGVPLPAGTAWGG
ncbi:tripartite tricarboxylate transporter TctB family protein [Thermus sp.]|uniref:tripartite tricarboxylate transporter TctB family protein n=1 Tax=Thermus sp. TaxID=275 RepID=UPI0025E15E18|nr:tripartite tricarboxylate transporter TctB family protein [Thermus sp.]MCS6867769.1 tripartite tricarboxylate transporter TctB family protein [Thermus sp.]MCX7850476.1 tripartite tricarboxylate transporter TctB family protein [Thermus sp.]